MPHRRVLEAEARATVRFETPPGHQLQVDFGEVRTPVAGESGRVFLFVATLGYSRRPFVRAFRHERQSAWLEGIEGAFRHFGGVTAEVLVDNAKALVSRHDAATREVSFNGRFLAFARYWGFRPRACAPYRARTKGKDERGVGYVKRNAIAGHRFESWAALEAHLARWTREVADVRVHGTTFEAPIARFERDEAAALKPVAGRAPFRQLRELVRVVQSDACIELDTNRYSVPWRLIGATVTVLAGEDGIVVSHAGAEVARHEARRGRRERAHPARASRRHRRCHRQGDGGAACCAAGVAAAAGRVRAPVGRSLVMADDILPDPLVAMLERLKLTALRDRLDNLLDDASRREMTLRETLGYLLAAEIGHREERRMRMATGIGAERITRRFPFLERFFADAATKAHASPRPPRARSRSSSAPTPVSSCSRSDG